MGFICGLFYVIGFVGEVGVVEFSLLLVLRDIVFIVFFRDDGRVIVFYGKVCVEFLLYLVRIGFEERR